VTKSSTRQIIDAYWAQRLGTGAAVLERDACTVIAHGGDMQGYHGVYALRTQTGCVVSAPPALETTIRTAIGERSPSQVFDSAFLQRAVGEQVERVVGPASIAHADDSDFVAAPASHVLQLRDGDRDALVRLRDACDETEWEQVGIDPGSSDPVFAAFDEGSIVAAVSWKEWGERIKHVGIITHPAQRGHGHGLAVASAITAHGLSIGGIMQWQALQSNAPSLAIGRRLGYQPRYESLALRLR
jgi:hypothetical protein